MTWENVATAEVVLMVPFTTTFAVLYGVFWPWYRSAQGRAIFAKAVGMALLIDFAVLYMVLPDHVLPPKEYVAPFVYAVILASQIGLVASLLLSWHTRHGVPPTDEERTL